jgi:hypothetical protein
MEQYLKTPEQSGVGQRMRVRRPELTASSMDLSTSQHKRSQRKEIINGIPEVHLKEKTRLSLFSSRYDIPIFFPS